jgi:hypothetical protein
MTPSDHSSLIVGIVAALVALISTQVAAIVTHWLTNIRDERKARVDRDAQRREVLRTKLENLIELLMAHLAELRTRSDLPIPLAATLAAGTTMPWKYDEGHLANDSMLRAQTLVVLHFPDLTEDVLELAKCAATFR